MLDRRRSSMELKKQKEKEQEVSKGYKMFMGAKVMWPPECDDDILEKTILECQNIFKTRDIQREGQVVTHHN